jgi:hypothetical protein
MEKILYSASSCTVHRFTSFKAKRMMNVWRGSCQRKLGTLAVSMASQTTSTNCSGLALFGLKDSVIVWPDCMGRFKSLQTRLVQRNLANDIGLSHRMQLHGITATANSLAVLHAITWKRIPHIPEPGTFP